MIQAPCLVLPNLAAEEGNDWQAFLRQPHARVAARLWSHLFSAETLVCTPSTEPVHDGTTWQRERCGDLWPSALGPPASEPSHAWLEAPGRAIPWLATSTLAATSERFLGRALFGPEPNLVSLVHDKAFAFEQAREGGLLPVSLESLITVLDACDLADPARCIERIQGSVAAWPDWTRGRFTLKPRLGSSGRGRIGGSLPLDEKTLAGALPRLARRGGAILEPWLERRADLSVSVYVPEPGDRDALPTLLGSLEMLTSPSGVFRGHCGEVDARGRVYSGHREDEQVRADSAWLAGKARERGFFGPCGVDALTYVEADRERLRSALEFNARATMGLVTLGLVRRALPLARDAIGLAAENRRAFLFTLLDGDTDTDGLAERLGEAAGDSSLGFALGHPGESKGPRPMLFFGRDRERLRQAHRELVGC